MYVSVVAIMTSLFLIMILLMSNMTFIIIKLWFNFFYTNIMFFFSAIMQKENVYFLAVVVIITTSIMVYCTFYMGSGYKNLNFMWTLMLFAFSMLCLILSDSIVTYLLGWDGLGASSFLLILFYNTLFSYRSGLATFLTNRLGDVFIIMSFIILGNVDSIQSMLQMYPMENMFLKLSFLFMLLGAATKSAQLPFSAWLPAAMAAPTPVSALVHSSTLVTAGIFLLYRYEFLSDQLFKNFSGLISLVGIVLSLLAGLMAFFETDLKKLVAMSTLSQLGILIYILFQKQPEITLTHIMSHAFFKSLLFLVIGYIIVVGMGVQDARTKTFTKTSSDLSLNLVMITSLSLMGFMYTPGFFSKDMILMSYPEQGLNVTVYLLLLFSCVMTVMYSTKSFIILMNNMHLKQSTSTANMDYTFVFPTMMLQILMLTFGYYFFFFMMESESYIMDFSNKILGPVIIISGFMTVFLLYNKAKNKKINMNRKNLTEKFSQMVNMNWISNNWVSSSATKIMAASKMENSWMEMFVEKKSVTFINSNTTEFSKNPKKMSSLELIMFFLLFVNLTLITSYIL